MVKRGQGRLESRPQAGKPAPQEGLPQNWVKAREADHRQDCRCGKPGGLLHTNCRCGKPGGLLHGVAADGVEEPWTVEACVALPARPPAWQAGRLAPHELPVWQAGRLAPRGLTARQAPQRADTLVRPYGARCEPCSSAIAAQAGSLLHALRSAGAEEHGGEFAEVDPPVKPCVSAGTLTESWFNARLLQ